MYAYCRRLPNACEKLEYDQQFYDDDLCAHKYVLLLAKIITVNTKWTTAIVHEYVRAAHI